MWYRLNSHNVSSGRGETGPGTQGRFGDANSEVLRGLQFHSGYITRVELCGELWYITGWQIKTNPWIIRYSGKVWGRQLSIESQCTQCIASLELASSQSPQIASLVGRVDCLFPVVRALKWDQGGQASIADPVAPQHWEYFIICKSLCVTGARPSENFKQLPWSYWSLGSWQRPLRISSER